MLAALGYAYVVGLLVILTGILFGAVLFGRWMVMEGAPWVVILVVALSIWLTVVIRVVVDALMIDIPAPDGAELRRDVAPALFQMIDELSAKLQAPRFDHVMISTDFNAGIRQFPMFGLFGRSVNYLWIGIPLMKILTPEQFRAVLAHELGHVSGNHSRYRARIYRLAGTWGTLNAGLKNESNLIGPFLRWYAPYFHAYTFALRRANEYDADKCAADVAGPGIAASTLAAVEAFGQYLDEKFWPSITDRAHRVEKPDVHPFSMMFRGEMIPSPNDCQRWYREALERRSGIADTHPCLTDRLEALGFRGIPAGKSTPGQPPVPLPQLPAVSAAEHFLGKWLEKYTEMLDREWAHKMAGQWRRTYEDGQIARDRLEELRGRYAAGALDVAGAKRMAALTHDIMGADAGIALLREFLQVRPMEAEYHFGLGIWLLDVDDEAGVASLQQAATLEPVRQVDASRAIAAFYQRRGEPEKAAPHEAYVRQNARYDGQSPDRIVLKRTDRFIYHALSPDVVTGIKAHLSTVYHVGAAYLVQRAEPAEGGRRVYVIVIEPDSGYVGSMNDVDLDRVAFDISRGIQVPGDLAIEFAVGQMKWLKKSVSELRSARML